MSLCGFWLVDDRSSKIGRFDSDLIIETDEFNIFDFDVVKKIALSIYNRMTDDEKSSCEAFYVCFGRSLDYNHCVVDLDTIETDNDRIFILI